MDHDAVRLHGRLSSTRRKWDQAAAMVATHLDVSPRSYVSWSGGKDSTAVALLADGRVPLIYRSHGVDYPEVLDYCTDVAGRHGWDYRLAVCNTAETYAATLVSPTDETPWHGRMGAASAALGYDPTGWLYGLRMDESPDRRRLLTSTRGAWISATGHHVCAPLWRWTALDVYAYLDHRGVDPCPVYARLSALGAPEGAQRVGFVIGGGGARMGRYVWLRRGWPDLWARAAELAPWLREVS